MRRNGQFVNGAVRLGRGSCGGFRLTAGLVLPAGIDEVFEFYSDVANLEAITPTWLHFQILSPCPIEMGIGTLIDYRLRLHRVPVHWQSEITAWEPPFRFVDEQRRGPYREWIHEHSFRDLGGETLIFDRVDYGVPFGALANRLLVANDLRKIFAYRHGKLWELFGSKNNESGTGTRAVCGILRIGHGGQAQRLSCR